MCWLLACAPSLVCWSTEDYVTAMWSSKEWVLDIVCLGWLRLSWALAGPAGEFLPSGELEQLTEWGGARWTWKRLEQTTFLQNPFTANTDCPAPLCCHELSREQRGALRCQGPGALGKEGREPGLDVLFSLQVAGGSCKKQQSHNWELTQKAEAFSAKASNY